MNTTIFKILNAILQHWFLTSMHWQPPNDALKLMLTLSKIYKRISRLVCYQLLLVLKISLSSTESTAFTALIALIIASRIIPAILLSWWATLTPSLKPPSSNQVGLTLPTLSSPIKLVLCRPSHAQLKNLFIMEKSVFPALLESTMISRLYNASKKGQLVMWMHSTRQERWLNEESTL